MTQEKDLIGQMFGEWKTLSRPGYFGRRKKQKHAMFDESYGPGNWRLVWILPPIEAGKFDADLAFEETPQRLLVPGAYEFADACKFFYEESYVRWFARMPAELEFVCTYGECIDNAPTNVDSGLDYTIQEAYSTHIQDIAVRNTLVRLGRKFEGPKDKILVIRSKDSEGYRFGPGNVPFHDPRRIVQPSKSPDWSNEGTVEDFWQSNKFLQVRT